MGARQLADILARHGHSADLIDITHNPGLLHLKSGLAWLGDGHLAVIPVLAGESHLSQLFIHPGTGKRRVCRQLPVGQSTVSWWRKAIPKFTRALEALGHPILHTGYVGVSQNGWRLELSIVEILNLHD